MKICLKALCTLSEDKFLGDIKKEVDEKRAQNHLEDSKGHLLQYLRKTHFMDVRPSDQSTATASICLILQ